MNVEALKKRLDRNRLMTTITIRLPEAVIEAALNELPQR